jgi:hypothetical protein
MFVLTLAGGVIAITVIKVVNYGRWAGKQGNLRGAIGLYLVAFATIAVPVTVYIINYLR